MKHTTSSTMKNKPLKWASQKERHSSPSSNNKSGRVSKRTSTSSRQNHTATKNLTVVSPVKILTAAVTETLSTITRNNTSSNYSNKKEQVSSTEEIAKLQRDLAFTYDTIATITVHFESLHHAYARCKPELDKAKSATRLGEMEKELLTAYDDLGLQVTHLERKITKLEKRISELRESPEYIYKNNHLQQQEQQQSTTTTTTTTTTTSPSLSVCEENDLQFMPSPCTSTDSLTSDNYLVSYTRGDYFTEEWAEKQKHQCEVQFQVQQVEQQYEQQYQYQQAEPEMMDNNNSYFYQQYETMYPSSFSNSNNISCGMNYYDLQEEQTFYSDKAGTYGVNPSEIFISYPIYATY